MNENQSELKKMNIERLSSKESNKISRKCLRIALIHLMSEKDYNKISITELVNRAGVSRATFYRNYNTKEDIIVEIINNLSKNIDEFLFCYKDDPYKFFLVLFNKIKEYKDIFYAMFSTKLSLGNAFSIINLFEKSNYSANVETHYKILAYEGACTYIAKDWVLNDMPQSPEKMAEICASIIKYNI